MQFINKLQEQARISTIVFWLVFWLLAFCFTACYIFSFMNGKHSHQVQETPFSRSMLKTAILLPEVCWNPLAIVPLWVPQFTQPKIRRIFLRAVSFLPAGHMSASANGF